MSDSVKKFKFKTLKVFGSDEWLANRTREYRTVFDQSETTYISAELAFYNKLFDESDWEAQITLKVFSVTEERKEISSQSETRKVRLDENIVYINKGWGSSTLGTFWHPGEYVWEAWIGEEMIGTKRFFIENSGMVTRDSNPYFDTESIRFYSGDFNAVSKKDKQYLKVFSKKETQYLYIEFKFKNKVEKEWNCELMFNWYNASGLLKARIERFKKVKVGVDEVVTFNEGWGNDIPGTWKDNFYRLEIVFMDQVISVVHLMGGEHNEYGDVDPEDNQLPFLDLELPSSSSGSEENLSKLNELIGLEGVKEQVKNHIDYLKFLRLRQEKGLNESEKINLHAVFTGNPGTGKTTVVKLLGQIYRSMGLLSKGHVKEVDRANLIGEYIGQTAPKVKKAIEEAKGGILFIDEAYALAREADDSKDFGKEALEILIKEMSDGSGDIAIMVAGYPQEMEVFINSNPGLKSRFKTHFHFDDYIPEELIEIAKSAAVSRNIEFTENALSVLEHELTDAYRKRDRTFGNARFAISIVDEAKMNLGLRLINHPDLNELSKQVLSTVEEEDVSKVFAHKMGKKAKLKLNEKQLNEALNELNSLISIDNVKNEINELVKLVRFYEEIGKDVTNKFSLHSVFLGNPGTGKTTVARIISKIYKALGLLDRGHIIETDKKGLVAGFVGQTATKTDDLIQKSKGGVLFIDEAYGLNDSGSFGSEVIETVLKRMEDMRGEFAVIMAGYTEPMNQLLESNPGLKSRFDRTYMFNDYSISELNQIALSFFEKEKMKLDQDAANYLTKYIESMWEYRDKFFGNGREIRKLVEQVIQNQNLRLASISKDVRTKEMLEEITLADLEEFKLIEGRKRGLGFKM